MYLNAVLTSMLRSPTQTNIPFRDDPGDVWIITVYVLLKDKHFGHVGGLISYVHKWLKIKVVQIELARWRGGFSVDLID